MTMAMVWVLLLVTAGLSMATAGPVPTSKPTTTWKGCDIGRFKSLSPRELEAFKMAKDALVSPYDYGLTSTPLALAPVPPGYSGLTSISSCNGLASVLSAVH